MSHTEHISDIYKKDGLMPLVFFFVLCLFYLTIVFAAAGCGFAEAANLWFVPTGIVLFDV